MSIKNTVFIPFFGPKNPLTLMGVELDNYSFAGVGNTSTGIFCNSGDGSFIKEMGLHSRSIAIKRNVHSLVDWGNARVEHIPNWLY